MVDDKLYGIAMTCAKANANGCNCACGVCQFNIFNYVSDVREAGILKATAYTDYQKTLEFESKEKARAVGTALVPILVIVGLVLFIMWCCTSCKAPPTQVKDIISYSCWEQQ